MGAVKNVLETFCVTVYILDGLQQISDKSIQKPKSFTARTVQTVKIQDGCHIHYNLKKKKIVNIYHLIWQKLNDQYGQNSNY